MSPICICPALMLLAPNHSIMTVTPYMMSVMTGPMNAMVRLTNSCVFMSAAARGIEALLLMPLAVEGADDRADRSAPRG